MVIPILSHCKESLEAVFISILLLYWSLKKVSPHWLTKQLNSEALAQAMGPFHVLEKKRLWAREFVGSPVHEWRGRRGQQGKEQGRWLKEAAQAERGGEGLSGGRCSMTNLTTPHLSSTLVPSTDTGPPRAQQTSPRTDTC